MNDMQNGAFRTGDFHPLPQAAQQYNTAFVTKHRCLKLLEDCSGSEGSTILVGMATTSDKTMEILKIFHGSAGSQVRFVRIPPEDIEFFLAESQMVLAHTTLKPSRGSHQYPIDSFIRVILDEAIRAGSVDIHFEPGQTQTKIRFKTIHGYLLFRTIDNFLGQALINRSRHICGLESLDRGTSVDGSFIHRYEDRDIPVRISIVPSVCGDSLTLRLLKTADDIPAISSFNFHNETQNFLSSLSKMPPGLLLFSGRTGCGKTTAAHSLLKQLQKHNTKIVTVEDPVEILHPGCEQIQVDMDPSVGYRNILKRLLRRSPDILFLGEIRDEISARLSLAAAYSGLLVLSTIHSTRPGNASGRFAGFDIEPEYYHEALLREISLERRVAGNQWRFVEVENLPEYHL